MLKDLKFKRIGELRCLVDTVRGYASIQPNPEDKKCLSHIFTTDFETVIYDGGLAVEYFYKIFNPEIIDVTKFKSDLKADKVAEEDEWFDDSI